MLRQVQPLRQPEAGIVLITGLMLVLALSVIGVVSVNITTLNQDMSAGFQAAKQAFYVAEAGLQHANRFLGQQSSSWSNYATAQTLLAATPLGALGTYTVTIENAGGGARRVLSTSTTPSRAGAVLEAMFLKRPVACGVCTRVDLVVAGGAVVDSFDSSLAPYNPATASSNTPLHANGNITVSGSGTLVKGNAAAGGTVTLDGGAAITGSTSNGAVPETFPPVTACGPPYSSGAGITGGSYDPATGDLSSAGSDITLADGLYCFRSISLTAGRTLTVHGPVQLVLTDEGKFSLGTIVNASQVAANLQISTSLVASNKGISVSGGSYAYMSLYAPDASVDLVGGNHFYGAIAGRYLTNTGGTSIHFDRALLEVTNGGVSLVAWRQVF